MRLYEKMTSLTHKNIPQSYTLKDNVLCITQDLHFRLFDGYLERDSLVAYKVVGSAVLIVDRFGFSFQLYSEDFPDFSVRNLERGVCQN